MERRVKKMKRENLEHIQTLFEEKTGAKVKKHRGVGAVASARITKLTVMAASVMALLTLSAFAYAKFSGAEENALGFFPVYKGEGVFEIRITNDSDKDLKLQDKVKLMQWSTGKEVPGNAKKIRMKGSWIKAHSEEVITIDLSDAFAVKELEQSLGAGDWYYFVLTNNNFVFGHDWTCSLDFDVEAAQKASLGKGERRSVEKDGNSPETAKEQWEKGELIFEEWIWPTESERVYARFGEQKNAMDADHVNIAGSLGDAVYSVADAKVVETGFEAETGNYVVLSLEEGFTVKYGYLQEIMVQEGEEILKGQKIGTMGKSGRATGPNLYFAVSQDGKAIWPLKEADAATKGE